MEYVKYLILVKHVTESIFANLRVCHESNLQAFVTTYLDS